MDKTDKSSTNSSADSSSNPPIGGEIIAPEREKILPRKKIIQPLSKEQTETSKPEVIKPATEAPVPDAATVNETPQTSPNDTSKQTARATSSQTSTEAVKPSPTVAALQKAKAVEQEKDSQTTAENLSNKPSLKDQPTGTKSTPSASKPDESSSQPTTDKPIESDAKEEVIQAPIVAPDNSKKPEDIQGVGPSEDYEVKISDRNWKKIGLIIAGVITLITIVVGAYFMFIAGDSTDNSEQVTEEVETVVAPIELTFFEETRELMEFSDDEGQSWQDVAAGTKITEGLWLRNNNPSAVPTIIKADNTEFRLEYQTTVTVDSSTDKLLQLGLRDGSVYVRRIGQPSEKIVVTMDNISAELKGIAMMVRENNEFERSYAFTGLITDEINDLNVEEGEQFTYEKNGGRKTASDIELTELKEDAFVGYNRSRDIETLELEESEMGVLFDLEPPPLNLTSPTAEDTFKIESGNESVNITFTGTSETDAQVTVTTNTDKKTKVTADDGGAFTIIVSATEEDTSYVIEAEDRSGNKTTVTLALTVVAAAEIDLSAVALPGEGVKASWEFVKGEPSADGIRLLWSDQPDVDLPVTGEGAATARGPCGDLSYGFKQLAGTAVTADVCLQDGGEYYFRLCSYVAADNSCEALSNEVAVTAPVFSGE